MRHRRLLSKGVGSFTTLPATCQGSHLWVRRRSIVDDGVRFDLHEHLGRDQRGHGHETRDGARSEEHTSELQSQSNLVCRLLLEKKKTLDERGACECLTDFRNIV